MRIGKTIKRDTQLIIISVLVLTLTTLSVSYSAIFSVQSQSTIQEITTGNLNVIIDNTSAAMSSEDLYPTAKSELPTSATSTSSGKYAKLNLSNSGNLPAEFTVTIGYDSIPSGSSTSDLIDFKYLNVGIFDVNNNKWINFGTSTTPVYYTPISGLTASGTNLYPILNDTINAASGTTATTRQFRIYIWLSEDTPVSEIGKLVYLKLNVDSATINGRVS